MTVREILLRVARRQIETANRERGTISYAELWALVMGLAPVNFDSRHVEQVIGWIAPLGAADIGAGRPPLDVLVVEPHTNQPAVALREWHRRSGIDYPPFEQAQQACWDYYCAESES